MQFPKSKMSHTSTYQGNVSDEGWLVLNIGNVELEGVNKIHIDLRDLNEIKGKSAKESDALDKAKKLLGGD